MISQYWKNVLIKILQIIGMLILYKLLTYAILPGITLSVINSITETTNNITNILFSSGVSKYSIMAAGIQPYISATMIMQILTSNIGLESFRKLKHEQGGNLVISEYIQYIMLGIAAMQGLYMAHNLYYYNFINKLPVVYLGQFWFYITTVLCIMTGSMIVLWIGNYISSLNMGSGTSFIICANLLSGENTIAEIYKLFMSGKISIQLLILIIGIFLGISFLSVAIENAKARVMVTYPNVEYTKDNIEVNRYIPLKVNNAGIMPLVMSSCMFQMFTLIFNILDRLGWFTHHIKYYLLKLTNPYSIVHYIFYAIMLFFFTYKYTEMSFNPQEVSQNLYLSGVVVEGVRPMENTQAFLVKKLNALNLLTFIIFILIVLIPTFLSYYINNIIGYNVINFGNSSLLILISTIENIMESIRKNVYNFYAIVKQYII